MPWNSLNVSLTPPAPFLHYNAGPGGFPTADAAREYITQQQQYAASVIIPFMKEGRREAAQMAVDAWLNRTPGCKALLVDNMFICVYEYNDANGLDYQAMVEARCVQLFWENDEIDVYLNPTEESVRRLLQEKPNIGEELAKIKTAD